jgi:hypothetical protein
MAVMNVPAIRATIAHVVAREWRIGKVDQELPADRQMISKHVLRILCDCSGGNDAAARH